MQPARRDSLLIALYLLSFATSAAAECKWLLWGQDESFWSYKLLNVIPGPTRRHAYIEGEYASESDCVQARFKQGQAQIEMWKFPEVKKDIEAFGGLRRVSHYACTPLPLKPERIDDTGWR